MQIFDEERLKSILIKEYNLQAFKAELMVKQLTKINEQLHETLNQWITDRTLSDFQVEGVDLALIMDKMKCNFPNALLILDTFIDNPDLAKRFHTVENPFFFDAIHY